jgi:rSAM/selenodomain-associated transferase 2
MTARAVAGRACARDRAKFPSVISIIIPTFNEARYLPGTLKATERNQSRHEVIVVDAGSFDGTIEIALERGTQLISSSVRQRAIQMNLGAQSARGDVFLFLHADTRLPQNALVEIESALTKRSVVGGGFVRRYESPSWFLRGTCALAGIRTRLSGWFLGDQAIFLRAEVFKTLGGFRDLNLFEDLDFSRRMRREGQVVTLRPAVISSPRRFSACHPWRRTWLDLLLTLRYLGGADPNRLAAEYYDEFENMQRAERVAAAANQVISS